MNLRIAIGLLTCSIALMPAACVWSRLAATLTFRWPQVVGDYSKQIKSDDIHQIVDLANAGADFKKPVVQINAFRSDEARVISGDPEKNGDPATFCNVRKKNGRWKICEESINTGPVLITG